MRIGFTYLSAPHRKFSLRVVFGGLEIVRCPFDAPRRHYHRFHFSVTSRCSVATIHPVIAVIHGFCLITPLLSPLIAEPDIWFGSPTVPHNTAGIKELKTRLNNGMLVLIKNDKNVIWLRQGPSVHHRTYPHGVVLSVVSLGGELSTAAKQIGRDKFA